MKPKTSAILLALLLATAALVYFHHPAVPPSSRPTEAPSHRNTETPSDLPSETPSHRNTETPSPNPPTRLQPIFASAGEPFAARLKALQALKGQFSPEEVESLYGFLRAAPASTGTPTHSEHALRNEAMEALCRQNPLPPNLLSNLCQFSADPNQDSVTRDYALQHIISLSLKAPAELAADRPLARETLWRALSETEGSLAGTALLGLHRLCAVDPSLQPARVSEMALKLARNRAAGELSRLTALQISAERQLRDVLPDAAALAREPGSLAVRAAAIAALGLAGGQPEKKLLQSLQPEAEAALQPALQSALRRLDQRLPQTSNPPL